MPVDLRAKKIGDANSQQHSGGRRSRKHLGRIRSANSVSNDPEAAVTISALPK